MSGIYIHIPFCKQACHYCDFHFSTNTAKQDDMVNALQQELILRKSEFEDDEVKTIYFGGGTPSLLQDEHIKQLLACVYEHYDIVDNPEITLEANPDDISEEKIAIWAASGINRLSIGVQSFFSEDLKLMNRAHNAQEAEDCIKMASRIFDNFSIDLIYGIPYMDNERWEQNIAKSLALDVPHISAYALTVEPKTALSNFIDKGIVAPLDDEVAEQQFKILSDTLEANGYVNYEISNFGKPGYFSRNNTAYWQGKKYMGIGPSAHSYDINQRGWNISNNAKYLKAIKVNNLPMEIEVLSTADKYNEYIMTGLRTIWGVSMSRIQADFGNQYCDYLISQSKKNIEKKLLYFEGDTLLTTKAGKFLVDGIASDLFMIKLN